MDILSNTEKIISTFVEIGVPKEKTLIIMYELLNNSTIYVNNQEAINEMLLDKLGIDLYISLKQYMPLY